jgi:hypothetical protein
MKFESFNRFIENKKAAEYDTKLAQFNARFPDGNGAEIVQAGGWKSVQDFLTDPDPAKWNKLRIPGQKNYV